MKLKLIALAGVIATMLSYHHVASLFADNDDDQPRKAVSSPQISMLWAAGYRWEDQVIDGMKYRVYFRAPRNGSQESLPPVVVTNITKDLLELDALKSKQ